jgi:hypothetical protein
MAEAVTYKATARKNKQEGSVNGLAAEIVVRERESEANFRFKFEISNGLRRRRAKAEQSRAEQSKAKQSKSKSEQKQKQRQKARAKGNCRSFDCDARHRPVHGWGARFALCDGGKRRARLRSG